MTDPLVIGITHPVVNYRHETRVQTAIVTSVGRKYIQVVMIDDCGLVCRSVPLSDSMHMSPLKYKGKPYPLPRAIRGYRRVSKRLGTTKRALKELKRVS